VNRLAALWITVGIAVSATAVLAGRSEVLIATGQPVFVPVFPRDPRSLIQGDYHRLRYRLVDVPDGAPVRGELALAIDGNRAVTGSRVLTGPLGADEVRIDYQLVDGEVEIAPRSFLIEEGTGSDFRSARYAELRVAADGRAILVRLRDQDRLPLGPEPRAW
jgi:uncharacterized membrane-anchored protein